MHKQFGEHFLSDLMFGLLFKKMVLISILQSYFSSILLKALLKEKGIFISIHLFQVQDLFVCI